MTDSTEVNASGEPSDGSSSSGARAGVLETPALRIRQLEEERDAMQRERDLLRALLKQRLGERSDKELADKLVALARERDEIRRIYLDLAERMRKLELGILFNTRERMPPAGGQIAMKLLAAVMQARTETDSSAAEVRRTPETSGPQSRSDGAAAAVTSALPTGDAASACVTTIDAADAPPASDTATAGASAGTPSVNTPDAPSTSGADVTATNSTAASASANGQKERKPKGRKRPPASLARLSFEIIPPEVQQLGLARFIRIGEERGEVLEKRRGGQVVVEVIRPKFLEIDLAASDSVAADAESDEPEAPSGKVQEDPARQASACAEPVGVREDRVDADRSAAQPHQRATPMAAVEDSRMKGAKGPRNRKERRREAKLNRKAEPLAQAEPRPSVRWRRPSIEEQLAGTAQPPRILIAPPLELPIPRGKAGPGLLAETIIRRFEEHMPLHRLERSYIRSGLPLARSTICGWHAEVAALFAPVVKAMHKEMLRQPILCTDATSILVQAPRKCDTGHFWTLIAPKQHVVFFYSRQHDSEAVDAMLSDFKGTLVADAHSVYDHLYRGGVIEAGCWAHVRRYFHRSLSTDQDRATRAMAMIAALFQIEELQAKASPAERLKVRRAQSKPITDAFFEWCDAELERLIEGSPIHTAVRYARNHRTALLRFLVDGAVPIHNNWSELQLRREKLGRKNWLFLGNDQAGTVNATIVSLLASCQIHDLEPEAYIRDLLCLLPDWPMPRILELAPAHWKKTLKDTDAQARLDAHPLRRIALDLDPLPPTHLPGRA